MRGKNDEYILPFMDLLRKKKAIDITNAADGVEHVYNLIEESRFDGICPLCGMYKSRVIERELIYSTSREGDEKKILIFDKVFSLPLIKLFIFCLFFFLPFL